MVTLPPFDPVPRDAPSQATRTWKTAFKTCAVLATAAVALLSIRNAWGQSTEVSDQFTVRFKGAMALSANPSVRRLELEQDQLDRLLVRHRIAARWVRASSDGLHVLRWDPSLNHADRSALLARLKSDVELSSAEQDAWVVPHAAATDPFYSEQWYLQTQQGTSGARFDRAWDVFKGNSAIRVAVVDTGVLYRHPDLAGKLLPGYDFVRDTFIGNDGDGLDADPSDPGDGLDSSAVRPPALSACQNRSSSWHGTMVAGLVAASMNNQIGISGAAPNVMVVPVRALGRCGGYASDVADAVRWAAGLEVPGVAGQNGYRVNPKPARVINLSLGHSGTCLGFEQAAIDAARAAGSVVVVAAGNSGGSLDAPASCTGTIAVGALGKDGKKPTYSAHGTGTTLMAPGGDTEALLSTSNTGTLGPSETYDAYRFYRGTSSATPLVASAAALVLGLRPQLSPDQVRQLLMSNAQPFVQDGLAAACTAGVQTQSCTCNMQECGAGMLDAEAAVKATLAMPGLAPSKAKPVVGFPVANNFKRIVLSSGLPASEQMGKLFRWAEVNNKQAQVVNGSSTAPLADSALAQSESIQLDLTPGESYTFQLTVQDGSASQQSTTCYSPPADGQTNPDPNTFICPSELSTGGDAGAGGGSSGGASGGGSGSMPGFAGLLILTAALALLRTQRLKAMRARRECSLRREP